jgi:hypothetical protein
MVIRSIDTLTNEERLFVKRRTDSRGGVRLANLLIEELGEAVIDDASGPIERQRNWFS